MGAGGIQILHALKYRAKDLAGDPFCQLPDLCRRLRAWLDERHRYLNPLGAMVLLDFRRQPVVLVDVSGDREHVPGSTGATFASQ